MCIQLTVVTFISLGFALCFEPQGWFWHHFLLFLPWMLFLAVSEGLGFTLMAMGQNYSPPTHAAIILSLEGVFASIASYLFLGETLSRREFMGCIMMLLATLIAKMGCMGIDRAPGASTVEKGSGSSNSSNSHANHSSSSPMKSSSSDIENSNSSSSFVDPLVELTTATAVPVVGVVNVLLTLIVLPFYKLHGAIMSLGANNYNNNTQVQSEITPDDVISGSDLPLLSSGNNNKAKESNDGLVHLSGGGGGGSGVEMRKM
eukprot:gene23594-29830_t